jgi:flavin-dependent dehydrogenase
MFDVLIVGAGPAGSVAATILARAGVRVRVIDRATFPRDKLCGDTVNPGALAVLRRLRMARAIDSCGLRVDGMRMTGENGVTIEGRYPRGFHGRALVRRDLDWMLLQDAVAAGADVETGVTVRRALLGGSGVAGVAIRGRNTDCELRAPVTIAADGRHSRITFGLGLAHHPPRLRRWAIGAYFDGLAPADAGPTLGEMHVRARRYVGIAPVPGGLANVCVVKTWEPGDPQFGDPAALIAREVDGDPMLRDRFENARIVGRAMVLGPLAVDTGPAAVDGLLLAGDAAGFIDPMTGDGLRLAVRGAELAAGAALEALARGWRGVHDRLAAARRNEFAWKWRFNRMVRSLVASPAAVATAAFGASVAPRVLRAAIVYAGDCPAASDQHLVSWR